MALWKYDSVNDKLVPLTSEGSIGLPVGAVMAFAQRTSNENWLLCDGRDTTGTAEELQTKYPALYTYLGNSNVLPAQFDHSKLSDIETLSLSNTSVTMQYDGILNGIRTQTGQCTITVNGTTVAIASLGASSYGNSFSIPFNKGDVIATVNVVDTVTVRYYKQPLYIKATSAGIEVDKDLYATKGYIRDQNVLDDYEAVTISQSSASPTIMPYDGFLHISYPAVSGGTGYARAIVINGITSGISAQAAADQYIYVPPIEFQKGDSVYLTSSATPAQLNARYYKLRDYTGR